MSHPAKNVPSSAEALFNIFCTLHMHERIREFDRGLESVITEFKNTSRRQHPGRFSVCSFTRGYFPISILLKRILDDFGVAIHRPSHLSTLVMQQSFANGTATQL